LNKLQLHGFNNLTKSLSFNIYDICYAPAEQQQAYIEYIDEAYNAKKLTQILNIAHQDYDPQGASVTMLISEGDSPRPPDMNSQPLGPIH
jgi:S-adenosylmethionine decarboxylase